MGESTAMTVASFMTTVGTIFSSAIDWLGDIGEAIAGNPILLTFVAIPLVGLGVGLFKRLLNVQ